MVMGVLASGNAFVGHLTNKANLHKKAAFKSYSFATCPRAGRTVKLTQQVNIAQRIRRTGNRAWSVGAWSVRAWSEENAPTRPSRTLPRSTLRRHGFSKHALRNAMSPLRIRRVESRGAKLEIQIQDG